MQNFSFQNIEILNKFQRYLYGHDDLFINLTSLFEKKKLPNKIIFNGSDGVGKATFIYHLINFILSNKEDYSYNVKAKEIDENNKVKWLRCLIVLQLTQLGASKFDLQIYFQNNITCISHHKNR